MKKEIEILKVGDEILTKLKEQPNNICTQLNKNEEISFNTGFHRGFVLGYTEAVKNCSIPDVINRRELLIDFCKSMQCHFIATEQSTIETGVDDYLKSINCL